jgi:hypothetical protein
MQKETKEGPGEWARVVSFRGRVVENAFWKNKTKRKR